MKAATVLWWLSSVPILHVLRASPSCQAEVSPTMKATHTSPTSRSAKSIPSGSTLTPLLLSEVTSPAAAAYPASCYAQGKWYIQGGYNRTLSIAGYSLDLTTPWNTTRPPWIRLPTSPEISTTNCVILPNMTSTPLGLKGPALLIFGNEYTSQPFASLLDLSNQTWISNATRQQVPFRPKGLVTISNPLDGKIYIRGGYHSENVSMMDIYNPQTDNFSTLPIPATPITGGDLSTGASGVPAAQWYAAAWCSKRDSILYFGGRPGTSDAYVPNAVYEYTPASNNWGVLDTTGPTPTAREGACMAIDQYSTKLVIFGGQNADNVLGDIHVLDLDTLMWKEGPSAADPRIGMACAMFDDGFLTWGGVKDHLLEMFLDPKPAIYNLTVKQWTLTYKMDALLASTPQGASSSGKSSTLALALGLCMGVIGLCAIGAGIFLYRREKRKVTENYGRMRTKGPDGSEGSSLNSPPGSLVKEDNPQVG